jgi:HEAT repeat protein
VSKRTRNLILLSLALFGVLACLFLFLREPSYQGRGITSWLRDYYESKQQVQAGSSGSPAPSMTPQQQFELQRQCHLAIQAIGSNAVLTLVNLVKTRDSSLKLKILNLVSKQHLISVKPPTARYYHQLSMEAFRILGPVLKNAVPSLIELLNDPDEDVRATATWNLGTIGPDASAAIPLLIKNLKDTNSTVGFYSLQSLADIHSEPEVVMPILIDALSKTQTQSTMYDVALIGLGKFGPQASNAIPLIKTFLTNNVSFVAEDATNALKKIDPIAAAQAGVK